MKGLYLFFISLGASLSLQAQLDTVVKQLNDTRYVEDQYYVGVGYTFLTNAPESVQQNNLSHYLQAGFIKDLPLNNRRNVALGVGVGLGFNTIYSNLYALETETGGVYQPVPAGVDYRRNYLSATMLEFPLEFRWRTSDAVTYRFWRIYTGVKFSYLLSGKSVYIGDPTEVTFSNSDLREWRYGVYASFGYNTWNFYAYYQLNGLFDDGVRTASGELIQARGLTIGLMFYIL